MQTFLTSIDPRQTAAELDQRRLCKQRVEAIQISRTLLGLSNGWKNHPAVKMWKGYESYLVRIYLMAMIQEWEKRGKNGSKCKKHYRNLQKLVSKDIEQPQWFDTKLFESHKSNLIRKDAKYYSIIYDNTEQKLDYVWPK